jgi:hypothetical protein
LAAKCFFVNQRLRIFLDMDVFFSRNIAKSWMSMPTVLRAGKYRFFFFSNERGEPRHIHVESDNDYAKFWLEPIDLAKSVGYKERELREIKEFIRENIGLLKAEWDAHFNS